MSSSTLEIEGVPCLSDNYGEAYSISQLPVLRTSSSIAMLKGLT